MSEIIAVIVAILGFAAMFALGRIFVSQLRKIKRLNAERKSAEYQVQMSRKMAEFSRHINTLKPGESYTWPSIEEGEKFWRRWLNRPLVKSERSSFSTSVSDEGLTVTRDQ